VLNSFAFLGKRYQECFIDFNYLNTSVDNINKFKNWFHKCNADNFFGSKNKSAYKLWAMNHKAMVKKFCLDFLDMLKKVKNIQVIENFDQIKTVIDKKFQ
jgi:hypothetical protein